MLAGVGSVSVMERLPSTSGLNSMIEVEPAMLYIGEAGQAAALTYETGAIGFNKLNPSARNSAKMG